MLPHLYRIVVRMSGIVLEHDRENCIGCGVCAAVAQDFWKLEDDGKATLLEGEKEGKMFKREVAEDAFEQNKQAAEGCPALVIHVFKDGKKVFPKE